VPAGPRPAAAPVAEAAQGKDGTWAAWSTGNLLLATITLSLSDEHYKALVAGLDDVMVAFRGRAELADTRPHLFDLADALQAYVKAKGTFPRGTPPRTPSPERVLGWRPDQRLSWLVDLLPYLGGGEYGNLRFDLDKSWGESPNLLRARIPVTYYLAPPQPGSSLRFQVSYPGHISLFAATHWVGIAGVGMDAASYRADDPAVATKLGIFGYDRVTRPDDVKDGLANTIVMIQVPAETAGPWIAGGGSTVRGVSEEPDCVQPFVCTQYQGKRGTFAIMGDGSVRFIPQNIPPDAFRAMCTIAGKDKVRDLNFAAPLIERAEPSPDKATPVAKAPEPARREEKKPAAAAPLELLQGAWQLVSGTWAGSALPADAVAVTQLTISGDKAVIKAPTGPKTATIKIDASKDPKWIDLDISGGKPQLGIFELSGDELKICLGDLNGSARPTAFGSSATTQHSLWTYQRVKR
jgi:uncharacterized protein (TIGR03067 family)